LSDKRLSGRRKAGSERRFGGWPFDIVGPVERLDERDIVFSKAVKGRLGPVLKKRMRDPVPDAFWRTVYPRRERERENSILWYLWDAVDGPVNPVPTEPLTRRPTRRGIKEMARFLGADLVGISELRSDFVYTNYANMFDAARAPWATRAAGASLRHLAGQGHGPAQAQHQPELHRERRDGAPVRRAGLHHLHAGGLHPELGYPAAPTTWPARPSSTNLWPSRPAGELGRNDTVISARFGPGMRWER